MSDVLQKRMTGVVTRLAKSSGSLGANSLAGFKSKKKCKRLTCEHDWLDLPEFGHRICVDCKTKQVRDLDAHVWKTVYVSTHKNPWRSWKTALKKRNALRRKL